MIENKKKIRFAPDDPKCFAREVDALNEQNECTVFVFSPRYRAVNPRSLYTRVVYYSPANLIESVFEHIIEYPRSRAIVFHCTVNINPIYEYQKYFE